jgi:hypothetical protein
MRLDDLKARLDDAGLVDTGLKQISSRTSVDAGEVVASLLVAGQSFYSLRPLTIADLRQLIGTDSAFQAVDAKYQPADRSYAWTLTIPITDALIAEAKKLEATKLAAVVADVNEAWTAAVAARDDNDISAIGVTDMLVAIKKGASVTEVNRQVASKSRARRDRIENDSAKAVIAHEQKRYRQKVDSFRPGATSTRKVAAPSGAARSFATSEAPPKVVHVRGRRRGSTAPVAIGKSDKKTKAKQQATAEVELKTPVPFLAKLANLAWSKAVSLGVGSSGDAYVDSHGFDDALFVVEQK